MRRRVRAALMLIALTGGSVNAQDIAVHAYIDARLVAAPDTQSWTQGGGGKTRYGSGDDGLQFGSAAWAIAWQATPSWLLFADVQYQSTDRHTLDVIESYLRYRPVSTTPWRASAKLGVFMPPVSLENDAVGWTSPWTLTPSAINSWVGEELRTKGVQGQLEWRGHWQTVEMSGALFKGNDPTGTLLADRGWSVSDLIYGPGSTLRVPDAYARVFGDPDHTRYNPFQEIDGRWGWYAHLAWQSPAYGRLQLMRYDNRADPAAHTLYEGSADVFAWHTYFWSLGARTDTRAVTWIAQAMDGGTRIDPFPGLGVETRFRSAFLLAGWNQGDWRPALRVEHFSTGTRVNGANTGRGESGNAVTVALNWRPRTWLRITGEVLRVIGDRSELKALGLPAHFAATQAQLSARLLY